MLLRAGIQIGFFRCAVIGDFPETEALNFLQHVMGKPPAADKDSESMPPVEDEDFSDDDSYGPLLSTPQWVMGGPVADQDWAHIYEVCPC